MGLIGSMLTDCVICAMVRETLMLPDHLLLEDAKTMAEDKRIGGLIRAAGNMILTALTVGKGMEKDFLGTARRATQWLDDEAITASLSASDFSLSDLKTRPASLFVVLPPDYIGGYSGFLRLFVKSALHEMGKPIDNGRRCLFLLDEFFSLGKLEEVAEAVGRMRSMGVTLWPFIQGLGQLEALYGREGAQTFLTNAAVHCFLGNDKDGHTLAHISRAIGNITPAEIRDAPPPIEFVAPKTATRRNALERGGFFNDFKHGDMGMFGKDHDEQSMVRRIETEDENARRRVDAENEAKRREIENANARARAEYDHDMKRVGQPRMTPDEIAALIGKDEALGDVVARSMIVLGPSGIRLNLGLAPYFLEPPPPPETIEEMLFDKDAHSPEFTGFRMVFDYAKKRGAQHFGTHGPIQMLHWKAHYANCWALRYYKRDPDGYGRIPQFEGAIIQPHNSDKAALDFFYIGRGEIHRHMLVISNGQPFNQRPDGTLQPLYHYLAQLSAAEPAM